MYFLNTLRLEYYACVTQSYATAGCIINSKLVGLNKLTPMLMVGPKLLLQF